MAFTKASSIHAVGTNTILLVLSKLFEEVAVIHTVVTIARQEEEECFGVALVLVAVVCHPKLLILKALHIYVIFVDGIHFWEWDAHQLSFDI